MAKEVEGHDRPHRLPDHPHSFAPEKGGNPGEGEWHEAPLQTTFAGRIDQTVRIDVPAGETLGRRALRFEVPPVAQWPAKGASFVALDMTSFDDAGNVREEESALFVAACVP